MFFLCQTWLPARKHVPSSLLCTRRASQARISLPVRLHLNQPFIGSSELQGERFNCCEEGFRAPKIVQQAPGPSPKVDSAVGSGHHQYRAFSGMAAGRCYCIYTHSEAKKGSKEATSLQGKHQGQTDILQKVQGLDY